MSTRRKSERIKKIAPSYTSKSDDSDSLDLNNMKHEIEAIEETYSKPTELFDDKTDRSGAKQYNFGVNRRSKMQQKVELTKTESQARANMSDGNKELRVKVEKIDVELWKQKSRKIQPSSPQYPSPKESDSESEEVSEEEYKPSDEEDDDDDDDLEESFQNSGNESEEIISEDENEKPQEPKPQVKRRALKTGESVAPNLCAEYHMKSSEYFEYQTAKVKTSNRTLSRLKHASLKPEQVKQLLTNQNHISKEHQKALTVLSEKCYNAFPMWEFILEEQFNILLYGLGSKRNIILDYQKEMACEHPSVVVNGYFPSLTLKEITDAILVDLMELSPIADANDCFNVINEVMSSSPNDRLYLFIHNIDGPNLRSDKTQDFLSRLAAIPNVHMIASIDHTDAPLLWDNVKRSRFNFFWWDATTFVPYQEETSYESSLLVQQSGALVLSSLQNVFKSLTSNAKQIYIMLIKYQLENGKGAQYQGMSFNQLYRDAKEKFYVSTDAALRDQLVEFKDHNLVKQKRNYEGTEYLIIPLKNEILEQFLEQQELQEM